LKNEKRLREKENAEIVDINFSQTLILVGEKVG
jgi:hypothetical protein